MDLYRQPVIDIKELDQKRELSSIIIIDFLTDDALKIGFHEFADRIAGKPSVGYDRIFDAHVGKLPAFSDLNVCSKLHLIAFFITLDEVLSHHLYQRIAAPRPLRCHRNEFKRI